MKITQTRVGTASGKKNPNLHSSENLCSMQNYYNSSFFPSPRRKGSSGIGPSFFFQEVVQFACPFLDLCSDITEMAFGKVVDIWTDNLIMYTSLKCQSIKGILYRYHIYCKGFFCIVYYWQCEGKETMHNEELYTNGQLVYSV